MERLKSLFQRADVPAETRDALSRATTPSQVITILEELCGRNGIELKRIEQDLFTVSSALDAEEDRIRQGNLTPVVETSVLRSVERLRKQRDNLDVRAVIYNGNINLHLDLIARIQEAEAAKHRGVGEDEIDEILEDASERIQEHQRVTVAGGEAAGPLNQAERTAEQQRLNKLKRELSDQKQKPVAERPARKTDLD